MLIPCRTKPLINNRTCKQIITSRVFKWRALPATPLYFFFLFHVASIGGINLWFLFMSSSPVMSHSKQFE